MVILFILTGYMICKCFKFWKSVAKNVQIAEFSLPEDLSVAKVGYVYIVWDILRLLVIMNKKD